MWRAVELREIRVFLVLCEELHFGRTAARLGLTQSRISQSMRDLERKLGVELAHRTSRRVALTSAGERLRDEAAVAVAELERVLRTTHDAGRDVLDAVRVGVSTASAGGKRLRSIVDRFEAEYPNGSVQLVGLPFRDRLGPLRRGEVEAIVTRLPLAEPDLVAGPVLLREPRMLAVARDHPLAVSDDVSMEALAEFPIGELAIAIPDGLADDFAPRLTPSGRPIPRLTAPPIREPSELLSAVARGRIVQPVSATFAESYHHPEVLYRPIQDLAASRIALAWRRRSRHPGLRAFLQVARSELRGPSHTERS